MDTLLCPRFEWFAWQIVVFGFFFVFYFAVGKMLKLFSHILNTSNAEWKRLAVGVLILFVCMWLSYIAKSFVYPELFFRFVVQNLDLWGWIKKNNHQAIHTWNTQPSCIWKQMRFHHSFSFRLCYSPSGRICNVLKWLVRSTAES